MLLLQLTSQLQHFPSEGNRLPSSLNKEDRWLFLNLCNGISAQRNALVTFSAKSGIGVLRNVCVLAFSCKKPLWCFALPRCESTINFLSHFTMQSQTLQKNLPLGVEVNSEAHSCSILRTLEEYDCLTLGMIAKSKRKHQ